MAVQIEKHNDGYLLEGKIYICFSKPEKNYINLMITKGEDMKYGEQDTFMIDFPGEYDKDSITIKVVDDKGGELNYLIKYTNGTAVAFVQTAKAFEDDDFANAKHILYVDPFIKTSMDKMEVEGEAIDLTKIVAE